MKVLIVDDESPARQRMRQLLVEEPGVVICGECGNGSEALDAIGVHGPDLLFLDIQMPGMDGFDLLRALPAEDRPLVVFVTAHDTHAVRAFEFHAVDYLLKPFRRERLRQCLEHARALLETRQEAASRLEGLLRDLPAPTPRSYPERLAVKDGARWFIVPSADVVWLEASGNYVEVHALSEKRPLLWRETMSRLESRLDPRVFFRVSRSAFVNLLQITEIRHEGKSGNVVLLKNGASVRMTASIEVLQARLQAE